MQQEYSLLKEENYQLKNEISQLKNAFDLNRDILKIISQQARSQQPRVQMLYQIINRLTSINNQIMINTAELIQQKNVYKFQKQSLKRQNLQLKEKINQSLKSPSLFDSKPTELTMYFKTKINELQEEIKSLQIDRIYKQQQIHTLHGKLSFYEQQAQKMSLIPTIDKKIQLQNIAKKIPETNNPQMTLKKPQTQTKLQIKLNILNKDMAKLKIYTQQLQYRLLVLIKALDLQDDIKKTESTNFKTERRKCLEKSHSRQLTEVKLIKFALNNLIKEQEDKELMFNITNRNINAQSRFFGQPSTRTRTRYLYKSVEKQNIVKMKPTIDSEQEQDQQLHSS